MPQQQTARQMLDREFLDVRCRLLEVAAALDRIDRSGQASSVRDDPRMALIHRALQVLMSKTTDRARGVQMVFSDSYDEEWRAG